MTKLDLQDTYLTIPVGPKSKIFLKVSWKGVLYQLTCLPFGLSPSARLFTKTLKPVIAFLRSMEISLLIFLDDILIMADSPERAAEHTEIVIRVLESLGFVIKKKKSILKPTQTILFLGFIVNSIKMLLLLPEGKTAKIKVICSISFRKCPHTQRNFKFFGSVPGSSASFADGSPPLQGYSERLDSGNFSTRRQSRLQKIMGLSEGAIKGLLWWIQGPA